MEGLVDSKRIELTQELPPWYHALSKCFSPGWQHQLEWPRWVGAGYVALDKIRVISRHISVSWNNSLERCNVKLNSVTAKSMPACMNIQSNSSGQIRDPECNFLDKTWSYEIYEHETPLSFTAPSVSCPTDWHPWRTKSETGWEGMRSGKETMWEALCDCNT